MGRNDKIASASPAFPAQNLILNDENWEAFLFTIQTDGQEAEQAASGYQSLLEAVGSGIRQKFTVISRPSLFSWAAENTKLYDVCKEAKALLDAGTPEGDIPNYVVARLLKARLITLKQDGIEARNATKAAKENPDPAPISPESGDKSKPVKKDDKEKDKEKEKEKEKEREKEKDKERAKSSPKKIAKGAPPPKQPEVVSRPSSGGASADQSKRKNKLRDRGVVRHEAKPTSIDDEPETGPDAYYLLKNFGNATFFSSLVDDAALPLNLVLRLTCAQCAESQPSQEEASQPATFTWRTTSDPFFASMRQAMHSSTDTSLWKHCTFRDLTLEEGRDAKELFDTVARAIYLILEKRKIYADFYSNDAIITIPDVDDLKLLENLRYFRSLVRASPCEKFLDVDLLCGILLEQVTRSNAAEDENEKSLLVESTRTEEIALLKQYFEAATSKLLIPKHTGSRTRLDHQTDANKNGSAEVFTAQATDVHAYLARRVGRLSSLGIEASAIIEQVSSVYRVRRYLDNMKRLVDQGAMEVPSLASRKLLGSTYTSQVSTDLDEDDMKRFLLFLDLETFLAPKSQDGTGMDLSEWRWEEDFDSHTFIQVLQKCRSVYPEIHAKFSEKEAALFLVMAGPGQLGAPEGQTDFEYQAKTRVMFGLFSELYDDKRHYLEQPPTSEKEDSSYSYVYSAGNQIMHFRETSKYMYPNACAYIQDRKLAFMDQTNERTITLQSDQFSINWRGPNSTRGEPYLTASFSNGTVFSVTKSTTNEGYSIQASTADGLTVEWDPHGRVYQRLLCPSYTFGSPAANDAASNTEIGRLILNEGVVVKYFFGTETEVLFPNGNVSRQSHDGSWTSTNGEGDKLSTSQDGHEVQSTLKSIREKDLTFNFTNVTREDMVTVKTEDNGTLTAEHADGTTIVTHGHQSDTAGIKNVPDSIIVKSREHAIVTTKPSLGTVIVELPDKTIIERSKGSSPDDGTIFRISQVGSP
ncbi:hypothetical protein DFS34DRAFT_309875 [Phlyctochytrium arcticum]|nr:hypothetical protein DFS34DRAFT_469743 [Phlyctochytrium arcticum]KAI9092102.1 hypothetical protein DFS34DRAFT_309875 [Phlyctochytrium arcticum]